LKLRKRTRHAHTLWVALLVATAAVAGVPAVSSGAEQPASAVSAVALSLALPDQDAEVLADASAPPTGHADEFDWSAADPAAPLVTVHRATTDVASTDAATTANVTLRGLRLWGGEFRIRTLDLKTHVDTASGTAKLVIDGLTFDGLVAPGVSAAPEPLQPGVALQVADWGTLTTGEEAADGTSVVALRLVLTAAHRGLPAGTELTLGVVALPPPPPVDPGDGGSGGSGGTGPGDGGNGGGGGGKGVGDGTGGSKGSGGGKHGGGHHRGEGGNHEGAGGGKTTHGQPPKVHLPPKIHAHLTNHGFVFPVWGPVSFSDDFGFPRADTIWHHGNDIFAAKGTPLLAVTDGTLHQVGWNTLGGQRLWLEADDGTVSFYYAHLDAFAPIAHDGAHVKAGDVIGFMGDSGDAAGTPYHLHFEVHPTALESLGYDGVIDPYPLLLAWQHLKDAPLIIGRPMRAPDTRTPLRAPVRLLGRPEGSGAQTVTHMVEIEAPAAKPKPAPQPPHPKPDPDTHNHLAIHENPLTDLVRAMRRGGG
jgi:murein DD-endopeptidase MepM/ murein hydrolase activator NlpD